MPILCQFLKWTPAGILVLLVLVGVASKFRAAGVNARLPFDNRRTGIIAYPPGTLTVSRRFHVQEPPPIWMAEHPPWDRDEWSALLGTRGFDGVEVSLPIPSLVTVVLPLAIGPFTYFRFRLWHYLAYTALVAVELAYYLRWQG